MTRDFNAEIKAEQEKLAERKVLLESLRQQFSTAFASFLSSWYPEQARKEIEAAADVTLSLPKEELKRIKEDVNTLAARAADIGTEHLSQLKIWWHLDESVGEERGSGLSARYVGYDKKLSAFLRDPMCFAMGELARILEPCGYLKGQGHPHFGQWRKTDSGEHGAASGKPFYPGFHMGWPDELVRLANKYNSGFEVGKKTRERISGLEREKARHEAGSKWDSA